MGCVFSITACNLYGGIDKPSGDTQLLSAARACLDTGDYACAQTNYQALSSAQNDVKISEQELTTLAQQNIFSISDLISTLGGSFGSGSSLALLTGVIASRGKTDGATRTALQAAYAADQNINDVNLKAFTQFLAAYAMLNQILASAVQNGTSLAQSDIVKNPSGCANLAVGACALDTTLCVAPTGSGLLDSTATEVTDLAHAANWSGPPTLAKVFYSLTGAAAGITQLKPSGATGIFKAINTLNSSFAQFSAAHLYACERQALLTTLFFSN